MAILEHKEFKIICDNCAEDICEWYPDKNRTACRKSVSKELGRKLGHKNQLCDTCFNAPLSQFMNRSTADLDTKAILKSFKTARKVNALGVINQNENGNES